MVQGPPKVFDYLTAREFVRDHILFLKAQGTYRVREFSISAGFTSYSYIQWIIDGKRSLTPKSAKLLARAFGLDDREEKFLLMLVSLNRTKSELIRKRILDDLDDLRKVHRSKTRLLDQYTFLSSWYTTAILEGLGSSFKKSTAKEMADALGLKVEDVEQSLKALQKMGLVQKKDSGWKRLEAYLETPPEIRSLGLKKFHLEMLDKSKDSIERFTSIERELGALTLSLTPESFEKLRKKLIRFQQEVGIQMASEDSRARVYQLNFQLFPLQGK